MKRFMQFLFVAAIVVSAVSMSFAVQFVSSTAVPMTATVSGTSGMTVAVKNVAGNTTATTIALGYLSSGGSAYATKAAQYVQVSVNDNAPSWKVRTWTNDYTSQPATATWGFQYGGLKGASNGSKIAMAWQAAISTTTGSAIVAGLPSLATTTGWSYLKDLKDVDDPTQTGDTSYTASDAAGYTTVAFGNGNYTNIVAPSVPVLATIALVNRTDSFYIYTEADLSVASADTYTGSLVIDLTNY